MYRIVRCPKCGAIQATISFSELHCKSCGASSVMRSEGQWAVEILAEVPDARTAGFVVRKLKLMQATRKK